MSTPESPGRASSLRTFRARVTMRYTRISCVPMGARMALDRYVQAKDRDDAARQVALCVDRDLEELLWAVNAQNVSEVWLELNAIEPRNLPVTTSLWNATPFEPGLLPPRHIVCRPA